MAGFAASGLGGHLVGRFCRRSPSPRHPADAPRSRPLSGRHRRFPDAPRSLARCAASGHPSRPSAMTCCFFSSLKTLLMPTEATCLPPESMSRALILVGRFSGDPHWPVLGDRCRVPMHSEFRRTMEAISSRLEKRHRTRIPAVLPIRVRSTERDERSFEDSRHTLDISANGSRIGAIRRQLRVGDHLTVIYRQSRLAFVVVWTRLMGTGEYQVGLQALRQDKEIWGLQPLDYSSERRPAANCSVLGAHS